MDRRTVLKQGLLSLGGLMVMGGAQAGFVGACRSLPFPKQPEGPFYPVVDQLDKDADLVVVKGKNRSALGQVIFVEGVITDQTCAAAAGVLVEIWQACESGRYDHPSDPNTAPLDPNFQYWGKAVTDANGFYRFRTIIPGAYPADENWMRPPHIHFKLSGLGYQELITQMYFSGEKFNDEDLILQKLSAESQARVIVNIEAQAGREHPVGLFNLRVEKIRKGRV